MLCLLIKIVKKLKQNECAGSVCMHPYPSPPFAMPLLIDSTQYILYYL